MKTNNYRTYLGVLILSLCLVKMALAQNTAEEWFQKGTQATSPDQKIQYYLKSIELDSTLVEAHYNLAYVYKNKEDYTNALTAFEKALNLGLKKKDERLNLSIFYELGICHKRLQNYYIAIEMLKNARKLAREEKIRVPILYELGRISMVIEKFDQALTFFNEGLELGEKNRELFQTAIEQASKEKLLDSLYVKGLSLLQEKDYAAATETFSKLNQIDQNYKDANIKLVELQNRKSDEPDVASGVKADELMQAGNVLFLQQKYEQALEKYQQVTEISPFNSRCYYNMGQCYERLKNNKLAIAAYQKALLIKNNFADAQTALNRLGGEALNEEVKDASFARGNSLFLQKKYNDAITEYSNFIKKEPLNFQAQYNIAVCYEQKGELELALRHYQNAFKMNESAENASEAITRTETKLKEKKLSALKQQIENDLDNERYWPANNRIRQYLQLAPGDQWAADKATVTNKALERQKEIATARELALKELEFDSSTTSPKDNLRADAGTDNNLANMDSESSPTDQTSQLLIYLFIGAIVLLVGIILLVMKNRSKTAKPGPGEEISDTSVHSFLVDCNAEKRTGRVTVKGEGGSSKNIEGTIHVKNGNIVAARCGDLVSFDALYELLETDIPQKLVFHENHIDSDANIHQATMPLLLQWKVKKSQ